MADTDPNTVNAEGGSWRLYFAAVRVGNPATNPGDWSAGAEPDADGSTSAAWINTAPDAGWLTAGYTPIGKTLVWNLYPQPKLVNVGETFHAEPPADWEGATWSLYRRLPIETEWSFQATYLFDEGPNEPDAAYTYQARLNSTPGNDVGIPSIEFRLI